MSDVRLAYHPEEHRTLSTARLACNGAGQGETNGALMSPQIRLALANGQAERNGTLGSVVRLADSLKSQMAANSARPALLVSYVYLTPFLANRQRYHYRDWALDSGAFSAYQSGTEIKLQEYINTCKRLMASDSTLSEIFALDVIGDWKASLSNTEEMWRQGVPAIPCYHIDEPESILKGLSRDYPKIALGGVAKAKSSVKLDFARQCFARVWPCRIHGFGYSTAETVMAVPWHSVDATNWEMGPCAFGRWASYGKMSVRGSKQNLRVEVEHFLRLEARARQRWAPQMTELDSLGPDVRLAMVIPSQKEAVAYRYQTAFERPS